jgi:hypothetical protein
MAQLDAQFVKFINYLVDQAKSSEDSLRAQGTCKSENYGGKEAPAKFSDENPNNAEEVRNHFLRTQIYQNFINCIEEHKPTYEAIANKLQGDFLAQLERDYKSQRLTRVRASFMEASRRHGHGDPQGVIKNGILRNVENWVRREGPREDTTNA